MGIINVPELLENYKCILWSAVYSTFFQLLSVRVKFNDCDHTRVRYPWMIDKTTEHFSKTKELNSQGINLGHQQGRHFIVLVHQHGRRDVMRKPTIKPGSNVKKSQHKF